MKILVTGATGQLGSEIKEISSDYKESKFVFCSSKELDICNHENVADFIETNEITTIINCAAYTAVDKAEQEVDKANAINHYAVANLSKIAADKKIQLVHISTDYVFDGTNHQPYTESDTPNPQSVYGVSKLAGEKAMLTANPPNSIIIRTSWLYSRFGNNFVKTMLRLAADRTELSVVSDQVGTPTNAFDLANVIFKILPQLENKNVEVFHYSNDGVCSWYDFAYTIFEKSNFKIKLNPIPTQQYPTPAKRPCFSILSKEKIKAKYDVESMHWTTSLSSYLLKQ